ncbi:MAG: fasciclin domain-containing protein [Planctomycetes bacterium]|nr:fasciclin domain-containing protein [Planctomycetota bacterium]
MLRFVPLFAAGLLAAGLAAQTPVDASAKPTKDIVGTAIGAGSFQTLIAAVKAAGLVETLQGEGPFTVFAPTDEAFAKLGKETIADLLKPENKAKLTAVLTYHVVPGNMPAGKVVTQTSLATAQGASLPIVANKDGVTVAGAKVVKTDVMATNGVIHVIDTVVLPPENIVATAAKAGKFQTLLTAATAAGLADTLANGGPFTVFAPTDEAFAKLGKETIAELLKPANKNRLANVLKYHVVAGVVKAADVVKLTEAKTLQGGAAAIKVADGKVMVDGANVVATDVAASNGVIHVIDTVILPR